MMDILPSINIQEARSVDIVISYRYEAKTQPAYVSNQEALRKVAEYLEKTTQLLKNRRLAHK